MLIIMAVGSTPAVLGFGALTAVVLGAYDYTGGALTGYKKDPEIDEFERKEALRKNRRRPIDQTIMEIGEGRGKGSLEEISNAANVLSKESTDQDMMRGGEKGSRRSMELRCQRSHKCFLVFD